VTATGPERAPLLEATNVQQRFPVTRSVLFGRPSAYLTAVDDVSLTLHEGETLGVVGESGCGKTSLARCLVRLARPTAGTIRYRGLDITHASARELRPVRAEVQMVFQDPEASLNPRQRVEQIVATGLRLRGIRGSKADREVRELLAQVGLNPEHANRFPHEFSGGQRQRIGVARALAVQPKVIVLDEPVSALDVSIQAQVINLLDDLQEERGLSYLFVAHDLAVVRHVSDRIAVMYLGQIVELASAEELYGRPLHPYTAALLAAIPSTDPARRGGRHRPAVAPGEPGNPISPPPGCRFHPRCARATELCLTTPPPLVAYPGDHLAACHHPLNADGIATAELSAAGDTTAMSARRNQGGERR
jgi:oligopeptide/dipeptide ABC transporter ATP-binding protein